MKSQIAIVGAGPAGLMAAERLAACGHGVTIYERMASPARKLLMAGRGGLNVTHSEDFKRFITRYEPGNGALRAALAAWPPEAMVAWLNGLGIETFTGTSGRVFPRAMKASPLLRAWLRRLDAAGVVLVTGHDWRGFTGDGSLMFETASGPAVVAAPDATLLALGGASWPRLGSNGAWVEVLARDGIGVTPLEASNCGIVTGWSAHVAKFAGEPLKRIAVTAGGTTVRGEAVITVAGLEGGAVYAVSSHVRAQLAASGAAKITLDLRPDMSVDELARRLSVPRNKQSVATFLRKAAALTPAAIALLREAGPLPAAPADLAARIKVVIIPVTGTQGLERAISTAGGVMFASLADGFMVRGRPGVFVAGEMIDWDAPTGGYLLQATCATAVAAANGIERWLDRRA